MSADHNGQNGDVLLEMRGLVIDGYSDDRWHEIIKGVDVVLRRGEIIGVIGESGAGKSTLGLAAMSFAQPGCKINGGSIIFDGIDLMKASEDEKCKLRGSRITYVAQSAAAAFNPSHRLIDQTVESTVRHGIKSESEAKSDARALYRDLQLPNPDSIGDRYPHQVSGGQLQRVMTAMAMSPRPDLIIFDEPTTALDVTIQAQILTLLKELQAELGMAILLITHDLGIVRKVSDRVCVMTNGEIVEADTVETIFSAPAHSYTQHLLASEPKGEPPTRQIEAREIVHCQDLRVWFPIKRGVFRRTVSHLKAVESVSLAVREGETVGVVGESGSGKTTLGLALLRLQSSTGSIQFQGREIQGLRWKEIRPLRREMQMVFQDPFSSLSPRMSVGSIIEEGLVIHKLGDAESRERQVIQVLEEVGLDPESRHRYPHEFSGGQRQRVAIARAIVLKPRLVILDEPTSALDRSVQAQIVDLLRDLQQRHSLSYLFISHDLRVVRAMSHYILVMRNGQVVEHGASGQIFENPQEAYTRQLMRAAFDLEVA